jgi:hypothetical protein
MNLCYARRKESLPRLPACRERCLTRGGQVRTRLRAETLLPAEMFSTQASRLASAKVHQEKHELYDAYVSSRLNDKAFS